MQIRVLSWNIHKGIGGVDRRYRPERTVAVIRHYVPDILLLQEVDEGVSRSSFDRQVDTLGNALGFSHRAYGPNVKVRRGQYGNATLSRWPLEEVANVDLTLGPKKRRGALVTRCRVAAGLQSRTILLCNLHLGLAGFERRIQLRRLLGHDALQEDRENDAVILGGDFNDLWGGLGTKLLEPAGFRRAGIRRPTYPAFFPMRPLDGVFVRGNLDPLRCYPANLPAARQASDHLPLIVDLFLPGTRGDLVLRRRRKRETADG